MISPRVLIATPVPASVPDAGFVGVGYHRCVLEMMHRFPSTEILTSSAFTNTDLVRARSRAVRFALDNGFTHLLFWDSDVHGDTSTAIAGMLASGHDLVACAYPRKKYPLRPANEVPLVAMGFTLLTERCMRTMWDAYYDELAFDDVIDGQAFRTVAMFQLMIVDVASPRPHKALLSEDYSFCERWLRLGEAIHVVDGLTLKHSGLHTFDMGPRSPAPPETGASS